MSSNDFNKVKDEMFERGGYGYFILQEIYEKRRKKIKSILKLIL
jgi:hypothetical protein